MALASVGTYAVFQSTLTDVSKTEGDLQTEQEQLSSGNASQTFAQMGSQTQQYLSLDNTLSRLNQYAADNQVLETRVNTTSNALTQIVTTATNLQNLISQRLSNTGNTAFSAQLTAYWQQISGALNTQVSGQYLFGGTKTNVQPVSDSTFPTMQEYNVPDASYYKGSNQDITVRSDDSTTLVVNVRADAPAFQKVYAGLVMAQTGDAQNNTTTLEQAYSLVQSGLQGIIGIQANVNANTLALTGSDTHNNTQKLYLTGIQQSIGNTDIVSVSTQVAVNQGILQAAFQAFAKINSLRLSDYLK